MSYPPTHEIMNISLNQSFPAESLPFESPHINNPAPTAPPSPTLSWSLSHEDQALQDAEQYKEKCNEGDTIFYNYYVNQKKIMTLSYLRKEGDQFKQCTMNGPLETIPRDWTYYAVPFPEYLLSNNRIQIE